MDIVVDGLTFPEAPRWRDGRLWFSDFYSHRVLAADPDGRVETMAEVPQQPSGLGWTLDGGLTPGPATGRRDACAPAARRSFAPAPSRRYRSRGNRKGQTTVWPFRQELA